MSKIGYLKSTSPNDTSELVGVISSLDLAINIRLTPNEQSGSEQAPSHRIMSRNPAGLEVEIGSAWTKTIQNSNRYGEVFFSMTLDDPSFAKPLNVAAFKDPHEDVWNITWRRRQETAQNQNSE